MAERKGRSRTHSAGSQARRSTQSGVGRAKNSKAGVWKAAALDRYLTVRASDTDAGDAARVIR
jgi:hypothetical protein